MTIALFPYPTVGHADPRLVARAIRVDGATRVMDVETRVVDLFGQRPWRRADLDLAFHLDPQTLAEHEAKHGPLGVVMAVASCASTNLRHSVEMIRSERDPSQWSVHLEIERCNVRDRIDLWAVATAAIGGVRHRPVAESPRWALFADKPASLGVKGGLDVRWVNFTDAEKAPPECQAHPHATHLVTFNQSKPELLLNANVEGLRQLLEDRKGRSPTEHALHDLQRTSIARGVWMVLLADALAAVQVDDGESPQWPAKSWQTEVLRLILPAVAPGKPDAELLSLAATDWRASPGAADFFARAEAVIGDLVRANEAVRRALLAYRSELT